MELKNKKMACLGDSIAYGFPLYNRNDVFHNIIKNKYDMKCSLNFGMNGIAFAKALNKDINFSDENINFSMRVNSIPADIDIVLVFGGTNDFALINSPLGSILSDDEYTFYGAFANLIKALKRRCKNAKIILLTPLHRFDDSFENQEGLYLSDYVDAIKLLASMNDLSVIDIYNRFSLDPNDKKYFFDGLHPNELGHKMLAEFVGSELEKL